MLADVAPIAARQTKRLVNRILRPPDLAAHLTEEIRLTLSAFTTDDSMEAVREWAHESARGSPVADHDRVDHPRTAADPTAADSPPSRCSELPAMLRRSTLTELVERGPAPEFSPSSLQPPPS